MDSNDPTPPPKETVRYVRKYYGSMWTVETLMQLLAMLLVAAVLIAMGWCVWFHDSEPRIKRIPATKTETSDELPDESRMIPAKPSLSEPLR